MSRRWSVRLDPARCDNWALEGMEQIDDLSTADAVLCWLIFRSTGIPFRITRDTTPTEQSNGHVRVTKNDAYVATFSGTPSDSKSFRNSLADCKRAGFEWPPPSKKELRSRDRRE